MEFKVEISESLLSAATEKTSITEPVSLVNAGGNGGVGEWRPEKNASGMYGTYEVDLGIGVTLEVIDPLTKEPVK